MSQSKKRNNLKSNNNDEFNWKEYLIANTDLIEGGINTEKKAKEHWLDRGKIEGRLLISKDFDWNQYIAINQDLISMGYTTKDLVQEHFINNGFNEGRRTVLKDFDWEFYIYYNNHLLHTGINTQSKAIKHWINYGNIEGLITNIRPLRYIYDKIISFDYSDIYNIYDNIHNITLYENFTVNDTVLLEKNLHYINNRNTPLFKPLEIIYDIKELHNYNKFILIIDFPCYGGGCSFFINTIISCYKYDVNFLIARNFENKIYLYINDEKMFKLPLTTEQTIEIFKKIEITKIFFNSIVKHSENFIQELFNLKKETTIITHDYSLFFNKPQMYYYEIDGTIKTHNKINIHNFDRVITQHIGNLHTFGKNMDNYGNIVVSALPDFKDRGDKIVTNNKTVIIGVIGDISDVKGYYVLNELTKKIEDENIEIIVFGKVHIKSIKKQFSYHTINDLNILLQMYKPNMLLELSLWPESYSFTLSLAMITQLPIIYHNKYFPCTIQRRLALYNNAHSFDNIDSININWLLSKKQSFFYLIKPKIYYPPFWDYYFKSNTDYLPFKQLNQEYNVVIITSKIYTSSKPFTYTASRSIYSPEERLKQTIETIKSIREKIPNSFIIIYDNSILSNDEYFSIVDRVECFINHHCDDIINNFTNNSPHKLFGEIAQTYKIIEYLNLYHKNMNIRNLFKITGRYVINEEFKYSDFDNDKILFKRNKDVEDRLYYFTCFYKISKNKIGLFRETITELFEDIKNDSYEFEEWEVLLPNLLFNEFETIDTLGVTQRIAVWDDQSKI